MKKSVKKRSKIKHKSKQRKSPTKLRRSIKSKHKSKRKKSTKKSKVKSKKKIQQNITRKESNDLYRMMKYVHDTFVKHGINYWMCGGNLLGIVRSGNKLLLNDDDLDICIMKNDVPKLKKLVSFFKKDGYDLTNEKDDEESDSDEEEGGKKCLTVKNSCSFYVEKNEGSLGLDIFVMVKKNNIVTYADPHWEEADNGGKKCYFLYEHLYPLTPRKLGNFYVYTPSNIIPHLNSCYGVSWNHMIQTLYNHKKQKWINSKPREMDSKDFFGIKPPKDTEDLVPPELIVK